MSLRWSYQHVTDKNDAKRQALDISNAYIHTYTHAVPLAVSYLFPFFPAFDLRSLQTYDIKVWSGF